MTGYTVFIRNETQRYQEQSRWVRKCNITPIIVSPLLLATSTGGHAV